MSDQAVQFHAESPREPRRCSELKGKLIKSAANKFFFYLRYWVNGPQYDGLQYAYATSVQPRRTVVSHEGITDPLDGFIIALKTNTKKYKLYSSYKKESS